MTRLRWLFFWRREHDDLAREMHAHIAERIDELVEGGMAETDACAQARREFGNVTLQAERSREAWIAPWLTSVWQDLRYAVRSLARQPGFTLSAVGILAIGMGLVMALFTAVNATVLRPWPVPDAASVAIPRAIPLPGQQYGVLSAPEFRYIRDNTRTFAHLAAWLGGGSLIRAGESVTSAQTRYVTSDYFDALRLAPASGRFFRHDDEDYQQPRAVAVISERVADRLFGESAAASGRALFVEGKPFTVIGVVRDSDARFGADMWMPLPSIELVHGNSDFDNPDASFASGVFGRLADGVEWSRANAEIDTLSSQFRSSLGRTSAGFTLHSTRPISADATDVARMVPVVGTVFTGLLLVLLLACANVGNLILARGMSRRRETAIRLSLGAPRRRIVRQFLIEALLLAAAAGTIASWIGYAVPIGLMRLRGSAAFDIDAARLAPDMTVFAFIVLLVVVATMLAGLAPSLRLARLDLAAHASNRHGDDRGSGRLRTGFLAAQIALSMVLLVAAGLMSRAIAYGLSHDPGFAIHEVQTVTFTLSGADEPHRRAFAQALNGALGGSELPQHAFSEFRAITGAFKNNVARRMDGNVEVTREVIVRNVSPTYFDTLRIPLIAGRAPGGEAAATEVVINQTAARGLWRDGNPLGQQLTIGRDTSRHSYVVVGVSADVPVRSVGRIDPVAYAPFDGPGTMMPGLLMVRSLSPAVVQQVTSLARSLEPDVQVAAFPLADDLRGAANELAVGSYVAWGLGSLALVLATVGAFGVFAYIVEERRREIGVRMALGATSANVVRTVVGGVRWPLAFGLGGGLLLSMLAAQLLRGALYGLSPFDPITYLGIAGILTVAALVATWIPALRATRIDPAVTLRGD